MGAFFNWVLNQISGPIGIPIVAIIFSIGIIEAMNHKSMKPFYGGLIGGAAFYALPWFVAAWQSTGGAGGGGP